MLVRPKALPGEDYHSSAWASITSAYMLVWSCDPRADIALVTRTDFLWGGMSAAQFFALCFFFSFLFVVFVKNNTRQHARKTFGIFQNFRGKCRQQCRC